MSGLSPLQRLTRGMPGHWQRTEARFLAEIAADYQSWQAGADFPRDAADDNFRLCRYLAQRIEALAERTRQLHRQQGAFNRRYAQAPGNAERHALILEAAAQLGASPKQLAGDAQALKRWFGADAIGERFRRRLSETERRLALCLRRLGATAAHALAAASADAVPQLWSRLDLERGVSPGLFYEGATQVREAAFSGLAEALHAISRDQAESLLDEALVQFVYRTALESLRPVWLQCEALNLLSAISRENFRQIARGRLASHAAADGDDIFVRRRIVALIGLLLPDNPDWAAELDVVVGDPSPYVRQQLADSLVLAPVDKVCSLLPRLLHDDPQPAVRAAAALRLPLLSGRGCGAAGDWLLAALGREGDAFVCRTLMHVAATFAAQADELPAAFLDALQHRLEAIHATAADLRVRRWAAQYREQLWLATTPAAAALADRLRPLIATCRPGGKRRLPDDLQDVPGTLLGRTLAALVQSDYGVEIERTRRGLILRRGHRFGFRLWRWLHEMRRPSPDKRQAFRHTIGRLFRGHLRAPSAILAELAETKVPGEPLQMASEGGWRPYLPLVDEVISALDESPAAGPVRLTTAEGTTEIHIPAGLLQRFRARSELTLRFAHYARLRNWLEDGETAAPAYLESLAALGIAVRFVPHDERAAGDPAVGRFFPLPALLAFPAEALWNRFESYFFSVFENSLFELMLFTGVALILFVVRHQVTHRRMLAARNTLPLVIGGWGTRGKSGTERIKAALFNALGYSVVSKTTGCEAMFLHGHMLDSLREMFLFRPYDKATIWEQYNVVRLAARLGCEVFLWECMALTPAFVRLLQRRWMRDDLSTITNTFPDHEDLQGPAGIDIPQVMTDFIPENGRLLTSEEQMRPILDTAAREAGTTLRGVGWLESGLLAPDVLARFPYQEHPDNIALVLALAGELGIAEDFALKEMADRVVPDLGVLKTYPPSAIDGRRLVFANGMSANERFGCLGNWRRLGFDQLTPAEHPGIFVSTVVNNRADRVARSQVFAGILVEDIAADRHFLIGSNLNGLQGYIRQSWDAHAAPLSLATGGQSETPTAILARHARRLRIPTTAQDVDRRLAAMLAGLGVAGAEALAGLWRTPTALADSLAGLEAARRDEILAAIGDYAARLEEFAALHERIAAAGGKPEALDEAFRAQLWEWFRQKIVVVEDFHASGDQIVALIARQTPPGLENRIMGIQNIKGTGLDFVYRWQAWETCQRACADLLSETPARIERGLSTLLPFQEFGLLCDESLRATIAKLRDARHFQQERHQASLAVIESNLEAAIRQLRESLQATRRVGRLERFLALIEGFFDAGDAIKRRKAADRIYADLVDERISSARAAIELQALNKRQKGGWLYAELSERYRQLVDRNA